MISVAVCIQSFSPARRSLPESTISTALASHWQWHCVPSASVLLLKSSIGSRLNRFLSCRRCCMPAYFNIFRSLEPLISDAGGRCSAGRFRPPRRECLGLPLLISYWQPSKDEPAKLAKRLSYPFCSRLGHQSYWTFDEALHISILQLFQLQLRPFIFRVLLGQENFARFQHQQLA